MSYFSGFKQKTVKIWLRARHGIAAIAVLLNGLLIFKTIYKLPISLFDIFKINSVSGIDFSLLANAPWFMLGIFLVLNFFGLLFRARLAWAMSIVLLLITLVYTIHFYPYLKFSICFCAISMLILILLKKDFESSSSTAGGIFALISFASLLFYSTYGALYFGEGFNPKIHNLMTSFYFSIETMTTVGYGDIVPVSESARLFTISVIISGITVFATSMTTIFGPLISGGINNLIKGNHKKMKRKDHFIVCGHSILAINTIQQLHQRGLDVTIITSHPEDELAQFEQRLEGKFDIVSGDSNDSAVLKKAGLDDCKAILALSDNDADNAFVILSAKDLNKDVKTVLAVCDSKNINKVKKVQPDVILSPQLFGSEILARILNGEQVDSSLLISMLLNSAHGIISENNTVKSDLLQENNGNAEGEASASTVSDDQNKNSEPFVEESDNKSTENSDK
ncbi:MAG: voltage-gated potassium channel protein [Plesiomonas sp.]|uniref:voltage-gated potassium channel protein n=1 Tax=Plesiomonas sp. TaxID=2486279 RepID=UPI003F3244C5